ncbi:MAG TPA: CotH kinase family protein [Verrucomicrobiae bacterium]|nr:CotH kinase family protein [Verrucomicrobiae bacterium]
MTITAILSFARAATTEGALTVGPLAHTPAQPKAGEAVIVTAPVKAPAGAGIAEVKLHLQLVEPGKYIRKTDPAYKTNWVEIPMHDDGRDGDAKAGDGVFTATVPGEWQRHRRLSRYWVSAKDTADVTARWPQATNASPNLAWFTYNGLPAWTGASHPGSTPALQFSSAFLGTLPAYHLIARADDVRKSQWDGSYNRQPFSGALVYDGRVYDHIQFHNRGQASTYIAGKNKWGFKFNPGQEFAAKDLWGRPYSRGWSGFNLNACASPWAQVNRGMAGMDEAVSYRAYQLAGVPAPDTFWVQFRVVDETAESSPTDQYQSDLWGLYLVVQEKNGGWLREQHLPDGNIYSVDSGPKHQARGMPTNSVDYVQFQSASYQDQTVNWWRTNFDLNAYYSFHALNRVLANIDLRQEGNHYLYHRPDGHWVALPHDLDMMFIPKTHWPGVINQTRCLKLPALRIEYQNRAREILDLFCSDAAPGGGQVGQLVAELGGKLCPSGQERNWAELDEAVWNFHPRNHAQGEFNVTPYGDSRMGGPWTRRLATPDFAGFRQYIVEFCTDSRPKKDYRPNDGNQLGYGYGFLWRESLDDKIPARPVIRYSGPEGFPADRLAFQTSAFESPANANASAVQWRIAPISSPGVAGFMAGQPCRYEIEPGWTSAELAPTATELHPPADACAGGKTYRARARYKDDTGRWSHWSEPVQFMAGAANKAVK